MRVFLQGFVLAFFDERPRYDSHIKRNFKMKNIKKIQEIREGEYRLEFNENEFLEFQFFKEENEESLEESEDKEDLKGGDGGLEEGDGELVIRVLQALKLFFEKLSKEKGTVRGSYLFEENLEENKKSITNEVNFTSNLEKDVEKCERAKRVYKAYWQSEKDFLELDFEMHSVLERESCFERVNVITLQYVSQISVSS